MLRRLSAQVRDRLQVSRDPVAFARRIGVHVGEDCRFLGLERSTFGSEPYLVWIGNHVTLTARVQFITHDGSVWILRKKYPNIDVFGRIVILDNVFIGLGSILLPGVRIGPNAIVAAGSVVNRDVPPDSVAAGVPCRRIHSVEEYENRVTSRAMHIRHLNVDTKRRLILKELDG